VEQLTWFALIIATTPTCKKSVTTAINLASRERYECSSCVEIDWTSKATNSKQYTLTKSLLSTALLPPAHQVGSLQFSFHSFHIGVESEIHRAAKIMHALNKAHAAQVGAVGIEHEGATIMIDAPMLKQVGA
jgi:hypothetical protein